MQLIDVRLPLFARKSWNSAEARDYWEPRLQRAERLYWRVERETIKRGIRSCTTWNLDPRTMHLELEQLTRDGLFFFPIRTVGRYTGFAHSHIPAAPGDPNAFLYGVVTNDYAAGMAFKEATLDPQSTRHSDLGALLGYPKCCRHFFEEVWSTQHLVDFIYQQAQNTAGVREVEERTLLVEAAPLLNVALRYFGLRICPLLPESYDCPSALDFVRQWQEIAFDLEPEAATDLMTILEMPYEWSAFKGYGVIHTPIFRGHFNTVPCYPEYRVRFMPRSPEYFDWTSFTYPSRGTAFPYSEFQLGRQLERVDTFRHVETEADQAANIRLVRGAGPDRPYTITPHEA